MAYSSSSDNRSPWTNQGARCADWPIRSHCFVPADGPFTPNRRHEAYILFPQLRERNPSVRSRFGALARCPLEARSPSTVCAWGWGGGQQSTPGDNRHPLANPLARRRDELLNTKNQGRTTIRPTTTLERPRSPLSAKLQRLAGATRGKQPQKKNTHTTNSHKN